MGRHAPLLSKNCPCHHLCWVPAQTLQTLHCGHLGGGHHRPRLALCVQGPQYNAPRESILGARRLAAGSPAVHFGPGVHSCAGVELCTHTSMLACCRKLQVVGWVGVSAAAHCARTHDSWLGVAAALAGRWWRPEGVPRVVRVDCRRCLACSCPRTTGHST